MKHPFELLKFAIMLFSEILSSITPNAEQTLTVPKGWSQGRALFGGLTAAIAYQHAAHGVDNTQQLRAMTVSFVGPMEPGEISLTRRVLREGKSVAQVSVELIQNGQIGLSALLTFGRSRDSQVRVTETPSADIPPREEGPAFPQTSVLPEFARHFDYRVSVGGLPFSNTQSRTFGGWVRYASENTAVSPGLFLGLVDAWPPAVLPHLSQPAPASSLTWTIEFPEPIPADKSTHHWWQYCAHIDYAADGYGHTHAHIWDEDGKLVAISRQTVTVFA